MAACSMPMRRGSVCGAKMDSCGCSQTWKKWPTSIAKRVRATCFRPLLKDFKGVLVSDFYAAYDAIQCPQQKCLIHLIRDLNDDLLKHPYDEELKRLAWPLRILVKPMVETIDRYGLKSRFLRKHLASVDRFYRRISDLTLQSEIAVKFKERFEKNRDKLFTFLSFDGVPWNNNNAEHAIKPFAKLRHIIGGVTTEKGIRDYLVLLSVCQTCKYMGVDFLDFLRSGEKDIHAFAESRRGRRRADANQPAGQLADRRNSAQLWATVTDRAFSHSDTACSTKTY